MTAKEPLQAKERDGATRSSSSSHREYLVIAASSALTEWVSLAIALSLGIMALSSVVMLFRVSKAPSEQAAPLLPAGLVQDEARKLLEQAKRDSAMPENPCYGRSIDCPLGHYQFDAAVRLEALKMLHPSPPPAAATP